MMAAVTRRATAMHEAGHAVAVCRFDGQIRCLSLSGRQTKGHWDNPPGISEENFAIYCFAGSAAEARSSRRPFDEVLQSSGRLDLELLDREVDGYSERWLADRKRDACTFVQEHWLSIRKVATALLMHRKLNHADVMALIDG